MSEEIGEIRDDTGVIDHYFSTPTLTPLQPRHTLRLNTSFSPYILFFPIISGALSLSANPPSAFNFGNPCSLFKYRKSFQGVPEASYVAEDTYLYSESAKITLCTFLSVTNNARTICEGFVNPISLSCWFCHFCFCFLVKERSEPQRRR
jgi:hypothetical protein